MSALYLTYELKLPARGTQLAILLDDSGNGDAVSILNKAAREWSKDKGIVVRPDLTTAPTPNAHIARIRDYLYTNREGDVPNPTRLRRHLDMLFTRGAIHRFSLRPGAPVEGPELFGRELLLVDLQNRLQSGSVHLRAPRRYGKTSVLWELERRVRRAGNRAVYVDLPAVGSAAGLATAIAMDIADAEGIATTNLPELDSLRGQSDNLIVRNARTRELSERISRDPYNFLDRLLVQFAENQIVLLLDECSTFLRIGFEEDASGTRRLLDSLAARRRESTPLRIVLCGSEGLNAWIIRHGLRAEFADIGFMNVPPLTQEDGMGLAEELFYGCDRYPSREVIHEVVRVLGEPVPYFVHALIDGVRAAHAPGSFSDPKDIDGIYQARLLGAHGNHVFRSYQVRSQPYSPNWRRAASRILQEIATEPEGGLDAHLRERAGLSTPDDFDDLMNCLEEDYDLVREDGKSRFRSKVLRDRWALREAWLVGTDG